MEDKTWEQQLGELVNELNNTGNSFSFHLQSAQKFLSALEKKFDTIENHASLSEVYDLYVVVERPLGLCEYINNLNDKYGDNLDHRTEIINLEGHVHDLSDHFIALFSDNVVINIIRITDEFDYNANMDMRNEIPSLYQSDLPKLYGVYEGISEALYKAIELYPDPNVLPLEVRTALLISCHGTSSTYMRRLASLEKS